MEALTAGLCLLTSSVLLTAVAHKPAGLQEFRDTLDGIGLPSPLVTWGAFAVMATELATATALVVWPGSGMAVVLLTSLGVAVASAGGLAMRNGAEVPCRCFSSQGTGRLGVRQVAYLPIVVGLALTIRTWPPSWSTLQGLGILVAVSTGTAVAYGAALLRQVQSAAGDRVALAEVFSG